MYLKKYIYTNNRTWRVCVKACVKTALRKRKNKVRACNFNIFFPFSMLLTHTTPESKSYVILEWCAVIAEGRSSLSILILQILDMITHCRLFIFIFLISLHPQKFSST